MYRILEQERDSREKKIGEIQIKYGTQLAMYKCWVLCIDICAKVVQCDETRKK